MLYYTKSRHVCAATQSSMLLLGVSRACRCTVHHSAVMFASRRVGASVAGICVSVRLVAVRTWRLRARVWTSDLSPGHRGRVRGAQSVRRSRGAGFPRGQAGKQRFAGQPHNGVFPCARASSAAPRTASITAVVAFPPPPPTHTPSCRVSPVTTVSHCLHVCRYLPGDVPKSQSGVHEVVRWRWRRQPGLCEGTLGEGTDADDLGPHTSDTVRRR